MDELVCAMCFLLDEVTFTAPAVTVINGHALCTFHAEKAPTGDLREVCEHLNRLGSNGAGN